MARIKKVFLSCHARERYHERIDSAATDSAIIRMVRKAQRSSGRGMRAYLRNVSPSHAHLCHSGSHVEYLLDHLQNVFVTRLVAKGCAILVTCWNRREWLEKTDEQHADGFARSAEVFSQQTSSG